MIRVAVDFIKAVFRIFPARYWLIGAVVLLACGFLLSWCGQRERLDTADDQATIGDARTESAIAAIDAIGDNALANTETQQQVEEIQNEIRNADPADRAVIARCGLRDLQGLPPCDRL